MITRETLQNYRELAESTQEVSTLGESTPLEFIALLDYIDELETALRNAQSGKGTYSTREWFSTSTDPRYIGVDFNEEELRLRLRAEYMGNFMDDVRVIPTEEQLRAWGYGRRRPNNEE